MEDTTLLTVSLGKDISICQGVDTTLKASTSGLNYVWKEKALTATTWTTRSETTQSISVNPTQTTDYIVYACNGYCQATDTVRVIINPIPVVTLKSDTTVSITINPTATFTAYVSNATRPLSSYTWAMSTDGGSTWSTIPATGALGTYTKLNDSTLQVSSITDTAMNGYLFKVIVTDATGCSSLETSNSVDTLTVVQGPKVSATVSATSCSNTTDGKLQFTFSAGEPNQEYHITVYKGSGYSDSNTPASSDLIATLSPDFYGGTTRTMSAITGLTAGTYTVILTPVGGLSGLKTIYHEYTITSPEAVSITLTGPSSACAGSTISLQASLTGGPSGGTQKYLWQRSSDGGQSYSTLSQNSSSTYNYTLSDTSVFRVVGYVNTCVDTSSTLEIEALPTPKASVLASDTGCYSYDLHNLQVVETSGVSDYTVSLYSAMPSSVDDDTYLIPESNYTIHKNMTVYAKLTVGGLCYNVASGKIYIKKMDQCYPITIPEFFSPDGDGVNDLFQISNLEAYDNPEIVIYDRYGRQVFKGGKEDLTAPNGWDGKYLSKDLPSADYWYEMKFKEIKTKVGHFSLKRRKE